MDESPIILADVRERKEMELSALIASTYRGPYTPNDIMRKGVRCSYDQGSDESNDQHDDECDDQHDDECDDQCKDECAMLSPSNDPSNSLLWLKKPYVVR